MNRPSRKARFRYAFDNYMSKGTGALILGLFAITALVVVIIAVVVEITGSLNNSATQGIDFIDLVWLTMLRTLDPGTMGSDAGTVVFVFGMLERDSRRDHPRRHAHRHHQPGLSTKLDELRKGQLAGHRERPRRHPGLVPADLRGHQPSLSRPTRTTARTSASSILADQDMVEMDDAIRQRMPDTKTTRIVCRSGEPVDLAVLDVMQRPQTSRSIIALSPDAR